MEMKGRPTSIHLQFSYGLKNFLITVNSMLKSRDFDTISVHDNGMSGYHINGFALGTMKVISENGTSIIHKIIDKLSENKLGVLIEL